jgi:hypothetical protein
LNDLTKLLGVRCFGIYLQISFQLDGGPWFVAAVTVDYRQKPVGLDHLISTKAQG